MKHSILLLQMTALIFSTCGLTTEREKAILDHYSDRSREKYADFLVETGKYTTIGVDYHQKFYRHLIGIASDIVEKKKLEVEKGTVGFYYDRISGEDRKLYLGLDIAAPDTFTQAYEAVAVSLIRKELREVIQTVNSCRSIFDEGDIVGMVVGWRWKSGGAQERVNVWILESDLLRFEDGMLTFDELVQRATITNSIGRVIRLPF